jgi:hypothetical protein
MRRLKIFAKGNVDVVETLHDCRLGGRLVWNGINQVLRERNMKAVVRLRHETSTGARGLTHPPSVDESIGAQAGALEPYPLAMQASSEVFETDADVIVLSILPDVAMRHYRSVESGGYLFVNHPNLLDQAAAASLGRTHVHAGLPTAEETFAGLQGVISRIKAHTQAPILIYNLSPVAPGPVTHCFLGLEDSIGTRIRRFNLMLVELSERTGVSIVDVDSVVAKAGADRAKLDIGHLTGDGARLVAEEVVRVLGEYGLFDD